MFAKRLFLTGLVIALLATLAAPALMAMPGDVVSYGLTEHMTGNSTLVLLRTHPDGDCEVPSGTGCPLPR